MNSDLAEEILKRAQDPQWWQRQAEYLRAGGTAIIERSDETFRASLTEHDTNKRFDIIASPEMWMAFTGVMLWGFSLENLIKGLFVLEANDAVWSENGKLKTRWDGKHGHDLIWLTRQIGFDASEEEKSVLKFITKVTVWGGRYPAPKSIEELGMHWGESEQNTVKNLYDRLHDRYPAP